MANVKNQESKLRRALAALGYALHKSRGFTGPDNMGGYMNVDLNTNAVVVGSRYEMTIEDVAEFLED